MAKTLKKLRSARGVLYTALAEPTSQLHAYLQKQPKPLLELADYLRVLPAVRRLVAGVDRVARSLATTASAGAGQVAATLKDMDRELTSETLDAWTAMITHHLSLVSTLDELQRRLTILRDHLEQVQLSGLASVRDAGWAALHLDRTGVTAWGPGRGRVRLEVYTPAPAPPGAVGAARAWLLHNAAEAAEYLRVGAGVVEGILGWKGAPTDLRHLLPPFAAHAMVVGGKHFLTFDGRLYDFTGRCSYLLAHDVIDDTFSIVINYAPRDSGTYRKTSLTVSHGAHQVEIQPDFRVLLDGRSAELPVVTAHTAVYRVLSTLHVVNKHGMRLSCEMPYDICTVSVSGWYYAKVAGLLGSFNNEPTDDFRSRAGHQAASAEELADGWSVGEERCPLMNQTEADKMVASAMKVDVCTQHFRSQNSVLAPCFTKVHPVGFMDMCIRGDTCQVVAFYARECSLRHVTVPVPKHCVQCDMAGSNQVMMSRGYFTLNDNMTQTAEVIFVISHGSCNRNIIARLSKLAHHLESALMLSNLRNIRFGLVGYGGGSMHFRPHAHTLDGRLMHTRAAFAKAIVHFQLSAPPLPVEETEPEDALSALAFAIQYPFHPGGSRTLILVPCHGCHVTNTSHETLDETLRTGNFRLMVLSTNDFRLRRNANGSPKLSDIFGLDRDRAYTRRDATQTADLGDVALRRQTAPPDNLCSAIAEDTGGAVFGSSLLAGHRRDRGSFVAVLTRVAAAKAGPAGCQHCQCVAENQGSGSGQLLCRNC